MSKFFIDRWVRIPLDHRFARDQTFRVTAPNPQFASAVAAGVDTDAPPTDRLYRRTDKHLLVPRGFAERELPDRILSRLVDRRAWRRVKYPNHADVELDTGQYRGQKVWVRRITEELKEYSGLIAEAETGFGKTVCACEVIFRMKQRTLVLVHTTFLMDQWRERLIAHGLKPHQIGFVRQDQCEYGGPYKVSIGMIQSILSRRGKHPRAFYRAFGLVITDEVHRVAATTFRRTITLFNSKYRLGVSATPTRKDRCESVFTTHIGPVAVVGRKRRIKPKIIHRIQKHKIYGNALKSWRNEGMQDNLVKTETYLTTHRKRNKRIIDILLNALKNKRRVLLLTSRRAHIEMLTLQLDAAIQISALSRRLKGLPTHKIGTDGIVGWLVGGQKKSKAAKEDQERQKNCPILLGTFKFAEEGLDIPALDVLVLATPRTRVVQPVGRILRDMPDKKQPVVVDFMDVGIGLCEGMAWARWAEYVRKRWVTGMPSGLPQQKWRRRR